jgi:hypothetical protein
MVIGPLASECRTFRDGQALRARGSTVDCMSEGSPDAALSGEQVEITVPLHERKGRDIMPLVLTRAMRRAGATSVGNGDGSAPAGDSRVSARKPMRVTTENDLVRVPTPT